MTDAALAIEVGQLKQQMKTSKKRTTRRKASKKKPSKKKSVRKWKLVRNTSKPNLVLYEKVPKKGYLLVVPKNSVVRDTVENRAKYASANMAVVYATAAST